MNTNTMMTKSELFNRLMELQKEMEKMEEIFNATLENEREEKVKKMVKDVVVIENKVNGIKVEVERVKRTQLLKKSNLEPIVAM